MGTNSINNLAMNLPFTTLRCFLPLSFTFSLLLLPVQAENTVVLDFEGLTDYEEILYYYDGGFGSLGAGPGPAYGVIASPGFITGIDADAGGMVNIGGEPSPDTVAWYSSLPSVYFNVPGGFSDGFSFYYSSIARTGQVTIYDGLDGTGNILATVVYPITTSDGGDPNGVYSPFFPFGVTFDGTAHSVVFSGGISQIAIDDVTFGSATAGALRSESVNTILTNTAKMNSWDLDADALLADSADIQIEGIMPRSLRIVDGKLTGMIGSPGLYAFSITLSKGIDYTRRSFEIKVIEASTTPVILGVTVNGHHTPTNVVTSATHGTPAITELFHISAPQDETLTVAFDWDWIKDPYDFRVVRGDLPAGLTMDGSTGIISGVPSEAGIYLIVVSVKDWRGRGYQWVQIEVEAP